MGSLSTFKLFFVPPPSYIVFIILVIILWPCTQFCVCVHVCMLHMCKKNCHLLNSSPRYFSAWGKRSQWNVSFFLYGIEMRQMHQKDLQFNIHCTYCSVYCLLNEWAVYKGTTVLHFSQCTGECSGRPCHCGHSAVLHNIKIQAKPDLLRVIPPHSSHLPHHNHTHKTVVKRWHRFIATTSFTNFPIQAEKWLGITEDIHMCCLVCALGFLISVPSTIWQQGAPVELART